MRKTFETTRILGVVVCPHCGKNNKDVRLCEHDRDCVPCYKCGKPFHYEREPGSIYTTTKAKKTDLSPFYR
jgi:hypothetical protein